ncbi:MAG: hypothetical protein CFE45_03285 [Burkholderiales bacterium PBB5]|nr:MAG: hypothetical protein CFE45_03285 [Burkholderiales bacterium PBB5]
MTRQDALAIAKAIVLSCGTYREPFEPPDWVLDVIQAAPFSRSILVSVPTPGVDIEIPQALACTTVDVEI